MTCAVTWELALHDQAGDEIAADWYRRIAFDPEVGRDGFVTLRFDQCNGDDRVVVVYGSVRRDGFEVLRFCLRPEFGGRFGVVVSRGVSVEVTLDATVLI